MKKVQRHIVAYLDSLLLSGDTSRQACVSAKRESQSATEKELSALMPSVLDRAFKVKL